MPPSYSYYRTPVSEIAVCDYRETLDAVRAAGGCDLVLTSPPYDDARTYGNEVSWKFGDYQALGDGVLAALKPGGSCLMVLDGPVREWRKGFGTERSFTPWRVMLDWAERVGFRVPDRLCYGRVGFPGKFPGRFRNDWEPLLWFQRGGDGYFDAEVLQEAASEASIKHSASRISVQTWDGEQSKQRRSHTAPGGMKNRGTLWWFGATGSGHDDPAALKTKHPARFCLTFAEDVVRCFCPPGGLVCDPFVGSGTSAVAAVRHGRLFAGGDLFGDADGKPWALHAHERVQAEMAKREVTA